MHVASRSKLINYYVGLRAFVAGIMTSKRIKSLACWVLFSGKRPVSSDKSETYTRLNASVNNGDLSDVVCYDARDATTQH